MATVNQTHAAHNARFIAEALAKHPGEMFIIPIESAEQHVTAAESIRRAVGLLGHSLAMSEVQKLAQANESISLTLTVRPTGITVSDVFYDKGGRVVRLIKRPTPPQTHLNIEVDAALARPQHREAARVFEAHYREEAQ